MDLSPYRDSADERGLRSAVHELAGRFDDTYWASCDEDHRFPSEFYRAFADAGWLGIAIPERWGGGGLGISEAGLVLQEVAASGAALNGCSAIHPTIFGINPVVVHGSDELRDRVLPMVVGGDLQIAFAVTEPTAGTDTSQIKTFACRVGDHYEVSGRKVWISKAIEAEMLLLLVRTTRIEEGQRRTDGMTLLLAPVDRASVDIRPIAKMGRNAVDSNEVFIDGLKVPLENRIGEEGEGFRLLLDGINPERILLAHESVGIGRVALAKAVQYANERVVFDRPIGQNQAIAHPLARSLAELDAAELTAREAAWLYDHGEPCARQANTAKYLAAEAAFRATDQAIQTLGGFGYAKEFHVERYFREARLMKIAPITQEMVLNYLAEHVLGLPRSY